MRLWMMVSSLPSSRPCVKFSRKQGNRSENHRRRRFPTWLMKFSWMEEVQQTRCETDVLGQLVAVTARLMQLLLKFQTAEATVAIICLEIIDVELSKNSVVALNGVLRDPPSSIVQGQMLQEMITLSLSAARSTDVSSNTNRELISGLYFGGRHSGTREDYDKQLHQ